MEFFIIFILIVLFILFLDSLPAKWLLILIITILLIIALFSDTHDKIDVFHNSALIITCFYAILITLWFNNQEGNLSVTYALIALFICGFLSIILSITFLYPFWNNIAYEEIIREVERSWWIFSYTEQIKEKIPKYEIVPLLDKTSMIAGPVEELAKLFSVLLLMRNRLTSKRIALFYVVLCALGFAMIENIYYFTQHDEVLFIRANPAHAVFSAVWGGALGSLLIKEKSLVYFLWMLFFGMGLHALWNLFATINHDLFIYLFVLVSWVGLFYIKSQLSKIKKQGVD